MTLDDPAGGSYGIRADIAAGQTVGSVHLQLVQGTEVREKTESWAPYSMYGDYGHDNLKGDSLPAGDWQLTATAYATKSLQGDVLGSLTVSFTVVEQQQSDAPVVDLDEAVAAVADPGPLAGFSLIAGGTGNVLAKLTDGATVVTGDYGTTSFAIRADLSDESGVHKVQLVLSGDAIATQTKNEWVSPYSLYGDDGADDLNGRPLPPGDYQLQATANATTSDADEVLGTLTINFSVVASR